MSNETATTEPWRQPRRSNNPSAAVQCPTCGAEPGWRYAPGLPQGPGAQRRGHRDKESVIDGDGIQQAMDGSED